MGVCWWLVPSVNSCLYSFANPSFIAARVFVTYASSVQHCLIQLLLGRAFTIFHWGTHTSRTVRMIGAIEVGGVRCDNISSTISIIGCVHDGRALPPSLAYLCVCVCVNLTSSGGGLPSDAVATARRIHPQQRLWHHTPTDSAHQFPPGENVNWRVSLGNVDRRVTANS